MNRGGDGEMQDVQHAVFEAQVSSLGSFKKIGSNTAWRSSQDEGSSIRL